MPQMTDIANKDAAYYSHYRRGKRGHELRAALAPALCPTSDPSWPESQPCSVCGAFGPWFDTPQIGECVEATRTARAPEQDK